MVWACSLYPQNRKRRRLSFLPRQRKHRTRKIGANPQRTRREIRHIFPHLSYESPLFWTSACCVQQKGPSHPWQKAPPWKRADKSAVAASVGPHQIGALTFVIAFSPFHSTFTIAILLYTTEVSCSDETKAFIFFGVFLWLFCLFV